MQLLAPRPLEHVALRPRAAAEEPQVAGDAVAEGPRVLWDLLQVGHPVPERRLKGGLVGEGQVEVVQPEAADKEHEERDDLHAGAASLSATVRWDGGGWWR